MTPVTAGSAVSVSVYQRAIRPNDLNLVKATLREVHKTRSNTVTFGGIYYGKDLTISEVFGGRTRALNNLTVPVGLGIGGRAALEGRPIGAANYYRSSQFSHEYDDFVRREGIVSIFAIPVMVGSKPRGMLYTSSREEHPVAERLVQDTVAYAKDIADEIKIRDEVDRRTQLLAQAQQVSEPDYQDMIELVRSTHAELIGLANSDIDDALARSLRVIAHQLQRGPEVVQNAPELTIREIEVLSQVAMGCPYADVAERLSLKPVTVKGYMRTILSKLHVHSRHEAVVVARRFGLIP